jgi:hypothetical protein
MHLAWGFLFPVQEKNVAEGDFYVVGEFPPDIGPYVADAILALPAAEREARMKYYRRHPHAALSARQSEDGEWVISWGGGVLLIYPGEA